MTGKILVLGGYGNFGKRIVRALAAKDIEVIVAGRSKAKAEAFSRSLGDDVTGRVSGIAMDVTTGLAEALMQLRPVVVVNTCGPFQGADYSVARTCIKAGVHYIDLADGRCFVTGIGVLDDAAVAAGVAVISGASTVPGLSSAVLDHFRSEISAFRTLKFGISPGQKAERGLATTKGILSYVGKPFRDYPGSQGRVFGWQGLYRQAYPGLGRRWMANCEIPDLDLLPARYGLETIRFSAGLELGVLHLGLWALSWLVRVGIPLPLARLAGPMLAISNWFDRFGSADGGMHVIVEGLGPDGEPIRKSWFIIAKDGDGPQIPTVPAIVLAARIARGELLRAGAYPCVGLVSLEDYLAELEGFAVGTHEM
ncbi:MAG: SDR family NAD(P)-dependent oxidoreductase [Nitratireductor sp.]